MVKEIFTSNKSLVTIQFNYITVKVVTSYQKIFWCFDHHYYQQSLVFLLRKEGLAYSTTLAT